MGVSDYIPIQSDQNNFELLARRIQTLVDAARKNETAERMTTRFRRTLERTTDAIYAADDEWRVEYMNEQMAERVDRDPAAIIGTTIWEEFPSIVGTELEERYRTAMETGEPTSFEQRLGEPFDYWVEVRVFPDDDGMTVFSQEITAERERERQLERSETILENIHDVVFVLDDEGTIEFANAAAERVFFQPGSERATGHKLEAVVGDRIGTADRERFVRAVETTLDGIQGDGGPRVLYDADLQLDVTTDDAEQTYDVRITPFESGPGQQVLVVARDVTERTETSRQLQRERDALRQLQTVMAKPDLSTETRLQEILEVGCQTLGLDIGIVSHIEDSTYTVEAVHGPNADIVAGEQYDLQSTYCEQVVREDSVCSFEDAAADGKATHPAYRKLGLESYLGVPLVVDNERYGTLNFSSTEPAESSFGSLERTFAELFAELVSAELSRRRDRAELKRQEFLFERIQEVAEIGVWEYDPSTGELDWSDGVRRIHDVEDEYVPSVDEALEFYHPADRETITTAFERAIEDGEPYDLDLRIVRRDGVVRDVRAWGERVDSSTQEDPVIRGVFQDITDRKSQRREYQELAEEYEALLDTSGDAIFMLDVDTGGAAPDFEFARLSPEYEAQTGLSTDDVRAKRHRRSSVTNRAPDSSRITLAVSNDVSQSRIVRS